MGDQRYTEWKCCKQNRREASGNLLLTPIDQGERNAEGVEREHQRKFPKFFFPGKLLPTDVHESKENTRRNREPKTCSKDRR